MALNFPGRGSSVEDAPDTIDATESAPAPEAPAAIDAAAEPDGEAAPARRRRRGTRGGRGRNASTAASATATEEAAEAPAPARTATRRRKTAAASDEAEATTEAPAAPKRASTRRRAAATAPEPEAEEAAPRRAAPRRRSRAAAEPEAEGEGALVAALKEQNEKLTRLVELQEQTIDRLSGGGEENGANAAAGLPRVGIFVDSANVELARDRSRGGRAIDWGVVLERLTKDRRLVRAVAYSPVHDDPDVSRETQRFVEPFLGKGFKIVTKPLKRFADGSIKANLDIELALDLMTMADRLDVAVIISGDGDFQHLVEVVQGRGVRVEVAGLGPSVAGALKAAADRYVELDFAQK